MQTIALTGGIACGKSTVLKLLGRRGIETLDCDEIVHSLYKKAHVKNRVKSEFGTADRKRLAQKIFSDAGARKRLERFLHPLVLRELLKKFAALERKKRAVVFVDVPLLFEAGLENCFSKSVVVFCRQNQQIARLKKQGFSNAQAMQRIKAQMPLSRKVKKADFAINNTGTEKRLEGEVQKFLSKAGVEK